MITSLQWVWISTSSAHFADAGSHGLRHHSTFSDFGSKFSQSYVATATLYVSMFPDSVDALQCGVNTRLIVIPHSLLDPRRFLTQVSSKVHMSEAKWLLFLGKNLSLEEFFTDINIPFDCEFLVAQPEDDLSVVVLTEVYRVGPTLPLQTYRFGNWTPGGGLTWPSQAFYQRRNNLQGIYLKTVTLPVVLQYYRSEGFSNDPKKFFTTIWALLEEVINFRTELSASNDGDVTEGSFTSNGSWTGIYGMLHRREVEFCCYPLTMTSLRMDAMDFTIPLLEIRTQVMIKKPHSYGMMWNSALLPFTRPLWIAVGVTVLLLAACLATAHGLRRSYGNVEQRDFGLSKSLLIVLSSFCQQGHSEVPRSTSLRVMFLTSYLTGVLVLGSYSAAFITHLTLRDPVLPFTDFEELLKDGTYHLGMLQKSAQLEYFKNSSVNLLRNIYEKLIAPNEANLDVFENEGLKRICYEKKYAHMTSTYMLMVPGFLPDCSIAMIPRAFYPGTMALAAVKKSPYLGLINFKLLEMRRYGVLRGLYEQFLFKLKLSTQGTEQKKLSVNLRDTAPILVTLAVGLTASAATFLLEMCSSNRHRDAVCQSKFKLSV